MKEVRCFLFIKNYIMKLVQSNMGLSDRDSEINFKDPYFTTQLITYIGNKRRLLPFINHGIEKVKKALGKDKIISFDGFAGSGVVSRLLKSHSDKLWSNDLEYYCEIINKCYLSNKSDVDLDWLKEKIKWLNENRLIGDEGIGFIEKNYAPKDDNNVQSGERVFYTNQNAKIIDNIKRLINQNIEKEKRYLLLAPLLIKASVHTNTSGVFKGFHKKDGVGHFGGRGENALFRIKREISLDLPIFSEDNCQTTILRDDLNHLVKSGSLPEFDLAYYDPPYNQHPYGSNYFMLNIIANGKEAKIQNGVSGIIEDWNRSNYNKREQAIVAMDDLIANTPAKYILISYNDEGIIPIQVFKDILNKYGTYELMYEKYNTYRGSRNLKDRNIKVNELLWILNKQ